jgi:hypothetical protein
MLSHHPPPECAADDASRAITCVGRCLGSNLLGRKCLFMDIIVIHEPFAAGAAEENEEDDEPVVHLVGNHVPRPVPLTVERVAAGSTVYSVFVALSAEEADKSNLLDPTCFLRFTASLGSPGELSLPRIGDVFRVTGRPGLPCHRKPWAVQLDATSVELLSRGRIARPGDYPLKWYEVVAAASNSSSSLTEAQRAQQQRSTRKAPGRPKRTGNRFRIFAQFCLDTFFSSSSAGGEGRVKIVDVAGGGGKLSAAFLLLSRAAGVGPLFEPTIIDPRNTTSRKGLAQFMTRGLRPRRPDGTGAGELHKGCHPGNENNEKTTTRASEAKDETRPNSDEEGASGEADRSSSLQLPPVIEDYFCSARHAEVVRASRLIVGLHCDGAVNEIIRAACTHHRSFAIVACCVFSREYPRQLSDGTAVTSREHLNAWILEECSRRGFQGATGIVRLPFEGANLCAYGVCSREA